MMLTGGIDDDEGKNSSPGGVLLTVLVAAVEVPANVGPAGAVPGDDATAAAVAGRVPPVGQAAT
jgi:hypothetical protein